MVADKMVYGQDGIEKRVWTNWNGYICYG